MESLCLIASVYKPEPTPELLLQPALSAPEGMVIKPLPQQPHSFGTTLDGASVTFLPADVDVTTFDLRFSIDDETDDHTLDASLDLFD